MEDLWDQGKSRVRFPAILYNMLQGNYSPLYALPSDPVELLGPWERTRVACHPIR